MPTRTLIASAVSVCSPEGPIRTTGSPSRSVGEKSTPNYAALEGEAIYDSSDGLPAGMKIFAGQTDDPFFVDLQVFDLLTLRGQAPPIGYNANNLAIDSLSGFNIHSLIIEAPISRVLSLIHI